MGLSYYVNCSMKICVGSVTFVELVLFVAFIAIYHVINLKFTYFMCLQDVKLLFIIVCLSLLIVRII